MVPKGFGPPVAFNNSSVSPVLSAQTIPCWVGVVPCQLQWSPSAFWITTLFTPLTTTFASGAHPDPFPWQVSVAPPPPVPHGLLLASVASVTVANTPFAGERLPKPATVVVGTPEPPRLPKFGCPGPAGACA